LAILKDNVVVNASLDKVWSLLTSPDAIKQWLTDIRVTGTEGNYPAVGSGLTWEYKIAGITLKGNLTVKALEPGKHIAYEITGLLTGTQNWDVSGDAGGVRVDVTNNYQLNAGVIGKVAAPILDQTTTATLKKSLAGLKQMAEK